jgi:hypothetical protein
MGVSGMSGNDNCDYIHIISFLGMYGILINKKNSKFDKNYDTENVSLQLNSDRSSMFCVILPNIKHAIILPILTYSINQKEIISSITNFITIYIFLNGFSKKRRYIVFPFHISHGLKMEYGSNSEHTLLLSALSLKFSSPTGKITQRRL